jgi:F420-dependent oxidoreductase-like protein
MNLSVFIEPQQGASYEDQLGAARAAEDAGFLGFFRSDHYMAFMGDGLPGPTDAWVTLAALARETKRVRLGTMVTPVTFRYPGALAISVAQVDAMSGGRVELGLGSGWFDGEHHAHAIPFPPTATRFEMLEEQLEILTGMWATKQGDKFSYKGSHYEVTDCPGLPKPAQDPLPIILGGAGKKKTPALAARFAAEFNVPFHPLDAATEQFERVRAACESVGRDPNTMRLSVALTICCGRDDAEVTRRAEAIGRPKDRIDVAGTPAEVVDRLGAFAAAGAERAYLQVLDLADLDHISLLGAEVLPQVA